MGDGTSRETASDEYEVVIAGAGPAGAQCARDLAARGYSVLVLETEAEDEFPRQSNKSTGGTFPRMLAEFGIPDDLVMHFTDEVVLESPNDHFTRYQPGGVLDFPAFKRWLVARGTEAGVEYSFDSRVNSPILENGSIVGVRHSGGEEVYGDIIIDATGPAATLAKALDVTELVRTNQGIAVEYEMEGVDLDHQGYADLTDSMMIRLDHDIAPGGYSWIFHTGEDTAKVGLTYIQNEGHRRHATPGMTIDEYLTEWLESDPRFQDAERIEGRHHRGSAHFQLPKHLSTDNFMAIGDTVPTVDPLWGEGIHVGMRSGRAAAITADESFIGRRRDTSAAALEAYDDLWHEWVAPDMETRLFMSRLMYRASNERYDTFMRDLRDIGPDALSNANAGRVRDILKLLHLEDLPLVVDVFRDRFRE